MGKYLLIVLALTVVADSAEAGLKEEQASIVQYCGSLKPDEVERQTLLPSPTYAATLRENRTLLRYFFYCRLWSQINRLWALQHRSAPNLVAKQEVHARALRARDAIWAHFFHLPQKQIEQVLFHGGKLKWPPDVNSEMYPKKASP